MNSKKESEYIAEIARLNHELKKYKPIANMTNCAKKTSIDRDIHNLTEELRISLLPVHDFNIAMIRGIIEIYEKHKFEDKGNDD